jgi:hypothetical protein
MSKTITIALILILTASSIITVQSATASITKPSVPEFTLKYVVDAFDVAPTYKTDPYTGKSVIDQEGFHVQNNTLQITIKNQPFTSQADSSGNYTTLYYAVAFKGHYEDRWQYNPYNALEKGSSSDGPMSSMRGGSYIDASHSDYTVISLSNWQSGNIPDGGQIDIRVQALIGHDNMVDWGRSFIGGGDWVTYYFEGEASDWSNTQTITISNGEVTINQSSVSPSPSPLQPTPTDSPTAEPTQNPTQTPIQPNTQTDVLSGFAWKDAALMVVCGIIATLAVALVLSRRKRA